MGLMAVDLAWVRTYVPWTPPTDDDLNAVYDTEWSEMIIRPTYEPAPWIRDDQIRVRVAVAMWFVRARLSGMVDDPSSWSVDSGEYSESWSANIAALRERLKELQEMGGSESPTGFGRMVRDDGNFRAPVPERLRPTGFRY